MAADGSVSTQVKEDIADIGLKATGAGETDAPINFSARVEKALINLGVDGFKSRKAFDLWGLHRGSSHARRPCRPRGGAQGPAQGARGARPQVRGGDRGAEDRRHRIARRNRAGGPQVSVRRSQRRAPEFDQPQRFRRGIEPARRAHPAQRRRARRRPRSMSRRRSRASTSRRRPTSGSPTSACRATDPSSPTITRTKSRRLSSAPARSRSSSPPRMSSRRRSTRTSPASSALTTTSRPAR